MDLAAGPDGSLYYLNRNVWVKDGKFKPNTGSLHRVFHVANSGRPAPLLTAQPDEVTASVGRQVTFRGEAKGQLPLRFQWHRNGRPVAGADGPTLAVQVMPADDGAEFRCVVRRHLQVARRRQ